LGAFSSLVPRREKFEPPGTPLDRDTHPLLFAELDDIADSLNEPLPGEVYRIGQGNAFVADRGGILGFGSRRIIAVGLPLLPFYFHRGNEKINVFALMDELIAGKLSGDAWVWRCNELGINGAPPALYNGGRPPTVPSN